MDRVMGDSHKPQSVDHGDLVRVDPFDWRQHARGCWAYSSHNVGNCDCTVRDRPYWTERGAR